MKKYIIIIPLILISFSNHKAQHLFPLHEGNIWIYWEFPEYYREVHIVGDTLMDNGKHYFTMKNKNEFYENYYRQEGDSVFSYDPHIDIEYLKFDFSANVGDTITEFLYSGNDTFRIVLTSKSEREYFDVKGNRFTFFINHTQLIDDETYLTVFDSLGIIGRQSTWFNERLSGALINGKEYGNITGLKRQNKVNSNFYLNQNYPNPFNPNTTISYQIFSKTFVKIDLYNILGERVNTLFSGNQTPGNFTVTLDGSDLLSGVYFYRLETENFIDTKKCLLLK